MRAVHYNNIDFSIDRDGRIGRVSIWHVMDDGDQAGNWNGLRERVKAWAGKPGDNWRIPDADSEGFSEDADYVIDSLRFKSLSRYIYEVEYKGSRRYLEAEMSGKPRYSVNSSGEKSVNASWLVNGDKLEGFLPDIGQVLDWAGELFLCSTVEARPLNAGVYEVNIQARDMSVIRLGNPSLRRNSVMETLKSARWRVDADSYEEFLAANAVNSDASDWAGPDYYVSSIDVSPQGKLGYHITLEARHVTVKMLEIRKQIRFLAFEVNGGISNETVYTGRWKLHRDACAEFDAMAGGDASEWAEAGFTVTSVNSTRISEMEFEYRLEARNLDSALRIHGSYHYDPKDKLGSRVDYHVSPSEFILTAEQCGWTFIDGKYVRINVVRDDSDPSWSAANDCPFKFSG